MTFYTVPRWPNDEHQYIVFEGSAATTFTLPDAYSSPGLSFVFKNQGTGTVTITTSSSQLIDGEATLTLTTQYADVTVFSDGHNWNVSTTVASGGGSSGTVTSVGLALPNIFTVTGSPVTTSGTLTAAMASQTAQFVLAAPTGAAGAPSFRQLAVADISGAAPLAGPTFTGIPAAPTATAGTNTTQLATTAFTTAAASAILASPTFTGVPAAPTATAGTNTTQLATTAFVTAAATLLAPKASPTFTGTVTLTGAVTNVTTQTAGNNTTLAASTAFVTAAVSAAATSGSGFPYDVVMPLHTIVPTASEVLLSFTTGRALTFNAGGALSWAVASVAPTGAVSCVIAVAGTPVGTVSFTAGNSAGTVNFTAVTNIIAGQKLTVTAPASVDATWAGITLTLGGHLT